VGELHDLEPSIRTRLLRRRDVAHTLDENFTASARDRVEPGLAQLPNDLPRLETKQLGKEVDFARRKSVNVNRMVLLDVPHQVEIPLEGNIRIVTALNQNLDGPE
jgi:hypothetical protein